MSKAYQPGERTVCTRPFEWFEVHPGGEVFLCCPAWLPRPVGNLLEEPAPEIWNGPRARELRKAVLNGTFHNCSRRRCPRLATGTGPVQSLAGVPRGPVGTALRQGESVLDYGPRVLNLCFDRSCNLACPTCRVAPYLAGGEEGARAARILETLRAEVFPGAAAIVLSGTGDPFASPLYRDLLRSVRAEDFPALERIELHTNGLLWDAAMWRSMEAVHPYVRAAEISVDAATSETYAAIRKGGDFPRLLRNLSYVASLPLDLKLSFVVQADNFREMPAFAELARRFGAAVYFSRLVNWGTFSREEFGRRAVHRLGHPEHGEFLAVLRRVASLSHVDPGNLLPLVAGGS
ncbi:radical SAM protein [Desulfuromonas sp.]|uniref:SPASM domain-containing protein n=1 Tax=Desulfuromonas sp. TaxID=892 RepID=UPI0025C3A1AB|nr:radical SAM protein [Desulfuromonas sp.]